MHIAYLLSGIVRTISRSPRPVRIERRHKALARSLLMFACSALPSVAQTFVSSFDNIHGPTFVALDANRAISGTTSTWLYVSEHGDINNTGGGRILRYNLAAQATAPVDIGGGHFVSPDAIVVDASTGDLTIADRAQDRITRISSTGAVKWTFGSGTAGAPDEMHGPCGLAIDSTGAIYIAEHGETLSSPAGAGGNYVSKYTVSSTGQAQRVFRVGGTGTANGQFATTGPYGIAIANNQLFVSDGFNARIQVFTLGGTYVTQFATPNALPLGLFVDPTNNLWVAESSGNGDGPIQQVQKLTTAGAPAGVVLTSSNPALSLPFDVAVDSTSGKAYVADYSNHRVAIFDLNATSGGSSSGGTSTGGTSTGGTSTGGTSTGGTSTGGTSTGGTSTGGTSTGGTSTGGTSTGGTSTGGTSTGGSSTGGVSSVQIVSATVPAAGTYRAGDALIFTVHFSAPVKVSGQAKDDHDDKGDDDRDDHDEDGALSVSWTALQGGDSGRAVAVGTKSGTDFTFKYQVHGNDLAGTGIQLGSTLLVPNGVKLTDAAGRSLSTAQLTIPWPQNPLRGVVLVRANDKDGDDKHDAKGTTSGPSAGGTTSAGSSSGGSSPGSVATGSSSSSASSSASGSGHGKKAKLVNLSSRLHVKGGDASRAVVIGFVVAGTDSKTLLIRAAGPALRAFGVLDALSDPTLTIHDSSGQTLATNAGWSASSQVGTVAAQVGAFALPANSRDAALLLTLKPGTYTASVASAASEGTALVEVYDTANDSTATSQLANISTRGFVDADGSVIAGFVVSGDTPKQVLIRAVGPTLATYGVSGVLADPALEIRDASSHMVGSNNDWSGADVSAAATATGAFPLPPGTKDAATVVTLQPGVYSAIVTGAAHTSGAVLVEVYELPTP
jgi:hypothetical protein